jgi:hypothetical protein
LIIWYWSATRTGVVNLTARDSEVSAVANPYKFLKTGLSNSTKYYFRFASFDSGCFPDTTAIDSLTTLSGADVTAPVISNVRDSLITYYSAQILWKTNEWSSSFVDWGHTTAYGFTNSGASDTLHVVNIYPGADSVWHFRVRSCDISANCDTSGDYNFTTLVTPIANPKYFIGRNK